MADTFTTSTPHGGVLFYELEIGGPVPTHLQLESIHTKFEIGQVPEATIKFTEAQGKGSNDASAGAHRFKPGDEVSIKLGSRTGTKPVFTGVLTKVGIKSKGSYFMINLTAKHKMIEMQQKRETVHHLEKKDNEAFGDILGKYGMAGKIDTTNWKHEDLTQFETKDLDFILSRADVNGLVVTPTVDGKIDVVIPEVSGPIATYTYGIDIADCDFEIDPDRQVDSFTAYSWDPDNQEVISATSNEPSVNNQGETSGKQLAGVLGGGNHVIHSSARLSETELQDWVDSNLMKMRLGRINGSITVDGNFDLVPNKVIKLQGLGPELDGDAYVKCVEHNVDSGSWSTTVQFGGPTEGFMQSEGGESISTPSAGGQMPGVTGMQVAKVKKIYDDPQEGFRIEVDVPVISAEGEGANDKVWARIMQPQASNGTGFYALPEEDDEVVLSYLNDDPRNAVIMGGLYSKARPMPVDPSGGGDFDGKSAENNIKGFFSREGLKMQFQETDLIIKIETPAGNIITMTEKDEEISIVDQNKNHIKMNPKGIQVYTPEDFTLTADKNIKMEAGIDFSFEAGANVSGKSGANSKYEAGAMMNLESAGINTIKGSLVKIN